LDKRFRLAIISSAFPFGSGESFLEQELLGLAESGLSIIVVPMRKIGKNRFKDLPLDYEVGIFRNKLNFSGFLRSLFENLSSEYRVGEKLYKIRFTQILRESVAAGYSLNLANFLKKNGVEHIHAYWAAGVATLAMNTSRLTGIPWSFSAHSWEMVQGINLHNKLTSASGARFISQRGQNLYMAISDQREKMTVIHLGVKIATADSLPDSQTSSVFRIACVANLISMKGHEYLLRAVQLLEDPRIELHLIGSGPRRSELANLVEQLKLSHQVVFCGFVPHEELLSKFRIGFYSLVVLPSIPDSTGQEEGIPVTLMEAMSFGIPVIATKTGSIPELIPEYLDLLVPPKDFVSLALKIQEVMNGNEALIGNLRLSLRKHVAKDFDSEVTSKILANWITGL
jgi:colanic acid/amylovoran biosynthesis glycosyltransferase